jgi:hypothetical protein
MSKTLRMRRRACRAAGLGPKRIRPGPAKISYFCIVILTDWSSLFFSGAGVSPATARSGVFARSVPIAQHD